MICKGRKMKKPLHIFCWVGLFLMIGFPLIGCEDKAERTQDQVEKSIKQQTTSPKKSQKPLQKTAENCDDITVKSEKDECLYNKMETLEARDVSKVYQIAQQIQDKMVQGAAVSKWIKMNNNKLDQNQGKRLCELLQGRDQFYCMRRLSSPHLKR